MKAIIYKILTIITIVVPTGIYLFLSATLFNIKPTHIITLGKDAMPMVEQYPDRLFYYSPTHDVKYSGNIEYNKEKRIYGIYLFDGEIIQVDKELFVIERNEETKAIEMNEISKFKLQTKEGVSLPIAFIITGGGVLLVSLIVGGKMSWFKKHKRLGVLLSMAFGTAVLYGINLIVSNLFNVFLIFTISWGIYCIEHMIVKGFKDEDELGQLKDALDNVLKK